MKKQRKAIALISTGLDSLLAAKIISDQGVKVLGLHFTFQFDPVLAKESLTLEHLFNPLGIDITKRDLTEMFLPRFLNPAHGYGSEVNPCIDCKILMFEQAKEIMDHKRYDFIVSGEVVGQRPMTQNKPIIFHIEKLTGLKGKILRPLSAQLLPLTIPEKEQWIDRNQLYDIHGRSRKKQIVLAQKLNIKKYPQPAGGCIFTNPQYAKRVKTLFQYKKKDFITVEDLQLLRLGRHFWPKGDLHIIVGRNQLDNQYMEKYQKGRWLFQNCTGKGPIVLAEGIQSDDEKQIVAEILMRYVNKRNRCEHSVLFEGFGEKGVIHVEKIDEKMIEEWRV